MWTKILILTKLEQIHSTSLTKHKNIYFTAYVKHSSTLLLVNWVASKRDRAWSSYCAKVGSHFRSRSSFLDELARNSRGNACFAGSFIKSKTITPQIVTAIFASGCWLNYLAKLAMFSLFFRQWTTVEVISIWSLHAYLHVWKRSQFFVPSQVNILPIQSYDCTQVWTCAHQNWGFVNINSRQLIKGVCAKDYVIELALWYQNFTIFSAWEKVNGDT